MRDELTESNRVVGESDGSKVGCLGLFGLYYTLSILSILLPLDRDTNNASTPREISSPRGSQETCHPQRIVVVV
jgi:hypothetical protein